MVLALRILERLAHDGQPMGVTALARALGTTKSRIFRHLADSREGGLYPPDRATRSGYQVGARLAALGRLAGDTFDLASVAAGMLRELRDSLGHFSVVSEVSRRECACLPRCPASPPWRSASSADLSCPSRLGAGKGGAGFRGREPAARRSARASNC